VSRIIQTRKLSKWYGNVLGLSDVTLEIKPGITGLLGPNGAGKSTLMKLLTGQIKPNIGKVEINGERVWNNPELFKRIGFCPEDDSFYDELSGRRFLEGLLRLQHYSSSEIKTRLDKTMDLVHLTRHQDRRIKSYSRGMRQRLKFAQAVAHEPDLLILDEPLNGLDPLGRRKIIRLVKQYRDEGKTVLVSSHVLPEIEAMTSTIILMHQGKIFAQGDIHYIRDLIEAHPHIVSISSDKSRELAAHLVQEEYIKKVDFGFGPHILRIETDNRDKFFRKLPGLIMKYGIQIEEIQSPDDNLQAVFDYLIGD
jgi:ABC-2 type transport system ATP-binding protein